MYIRSPRMEADWDHGDRGKSCESCENVGQKLYSDRFQDSFRYNTEKTTPATLVAHFYRRRIRACDPYGAIDKKEAATLTFTVGRVKAFTEQNDIHDTIPRLKRVWLGSFGTQVVICSFLYCSTDSSPTYV